MNFRSTLSGVKDTDLIILSKLSNRDLLSLCSVDQYTNELCHEESFWINRIKKYGNLVKYKPAIMTWRNYYLRILAAVNSEEDIRSLPGTFFIWRNDIDRIIQYCPQQKSNNILIVISQIRSNLIAMNHGVDRCAICEGKLSENNPYFDVEEAPGSTKCMWKNIGTVSNDISAYTVDPIVRGKCGHVFHNSCMNKWRRKKDVCPIDNGFWDPVMMDSFVTGVTDTKS